jgi:hypothetical protein
MNVDLLIKLRLMLELSGNFSKRLGKPKIPCPPQLMMLEQNKREVLSGLDAQYYKNI